MNTSPEQIWKKHTIVIYFREKGSCTVYRETNWDADKLLLEIENTDGWVTVPHSTGYGSNAYYRFRAADVNCISVQHER